MQTTISELTIDQLKTIIGEVFDEKVQQYLSDDDDEGEMRPEFIERIVAQRKLLAMGERGVPMEKVMEEMGIR